MDKADKASLNNEMVSAARRITTLEMKELNERQRAEHAQKIYEHTKNSLRQVEERNLELESKFAEVRDQRNQAHEICCCSRQSVWQSFNELCKSQKATGFTWQTRAVL